MSAYAAYAHVWRTTSISEMPALLHAGLDHANNEHYSATHSSPPNPQQLRMEKARRLA
ncbi:hypothetical protein BCR33DRAFT_713185, partial [Rhizoclosmatium globosum]